MRPSIMLASALAATALAKPLEKRQVVVTDVEVVYTTVFDTVTAGQQPAATPAPAASPAAVHHKHGHHSRPGGKKPVPLSLSTAPAAPAPSSQAPAPIAPAPSSQAPAPVAPAPSSSEAAAPAPAPATTSPTPAQPTGGVASTYQQAVVNHHNYHRANHSSPDISWSDSLAATAMKIAKTCVYAHSMDVDGGNYGQNIAAGNGASDIAAIISDQFYNGEINSFTDYGVAQPDMNSFEKWGHMSQIVWKSTTKVGCATWNCGSSLANFNAPNGIYTVCNYSPPGNYQNEYGNNIGNSKNLATVPGTYSVDSGAIGSSYTGSTGQSLT